MTRLRMFSIGLSVLLAAAAVPGCGSCESTTSQAVTPAELFTHAISDIYIERDEKDPLAAFSAAVAVAEELRSGAPFADVARRHSNQETSAARGGWLGFHKTDDSAFSAAVQAVPIGQVGGPIMVRTGYIFIRRHTLEEARAIEQKYAIPAYGFYLPYGEEMGGGATKEATQRLAETAWEAVSSGRLTLQEAATEYGAVPSPRADHFIGNVSDGEERKAIYDGVSGVGPGELTPLLELQSEFAVVRRGVYFRSVVRHIMVQHKDSAAEELEVTRSREGARALAEEALASVLEQPSTWADAVLRYTDAAGVREMQGGIGLVTNGDLPPALEAAVLRTKPGAILDRVVESVDGFHVIWRVN